MKNMLFHSAIPLSHQMNVKRHLFPDAQYVRVCDVLLKFENS